MHARRVRNIACNGSLQLKALMRHTQSHACLRNCCRNAITLHAPLVNVADSSTSHVSKTATQMNICRKIHCISHAAKNMSTRGVL
jgi:hypothetical protein